MRLLNTSTLELEEFFIDIPDYAILSHTWGEGEVSFQDIHLDHAQLATNRTGVFKVWSSCKEAALDNYKYIWIDTLCIDKSSSTGISEAIHSMYRWYRNSGVCYVYLPDVPAPVDGKWHSNLELLDQFEKSRWFRRGWTVQELLASSNLRFYGAEWGVSIGTKKDLIQDIARITKIDLQHTSSSSSFCLAILCFNILWNCFALTQRGDSSTDETVLGG